ncbi:hypothetical protein E4U53_000865, partial [Claviceps sorghi]
MSGLWPLDMYKSPDVNTKCIFKTSSHDTLRPLLAAPRSWEPGKAREEHIKAVDLGTPSAVVAPSSREQRLR